MWKQKPCIICYRLISTFQLGGTHLSDTTPEKLMRFFKLMGRYLGEDHNTAEISIRLPLLKQVLQNDMLICCEDCSKIVDSFCQLYHQLKSIEVLLNWKVWKLNDIMSANQGLPTKIVDFDKNVADEVMNFKDDLIKKCTQKLQAQVPRIPISKCLSKSRQRAIHQPKAGSSKTSNSQIEFGAFENSPGENKSDRDDDIDDRTNQLKQLVPTEEVKIVEVSSVPGTKTVPSKTKNSTLSSKNAPKLWIKIVPPECKSQLENGKMKSNVHSQNGKLECKICLRGFSSMTNYKTHFEGAHLNVRYQCVSCGQIFKQKNSCLKHNRGVHLSEGAFKCPICNKGFTQRPTLLSHLYSAHSIGERYHCKFCFTAFARLHSRNQHMNKCSARKVHGDGNSDRGSDSIPFPQPSSAGSLISHVKLESLDATILPDYDGPEGSPHDLRDQPIIIDTNDGPNVKQETIIFTEAEVDTSCSPELEVSGCDIAGKLESDLLEANTLDKQSGN